LPADSNTIVNRWKSYFSQLLNVHNVSAVRQVEIHPDEPLLSGPSHLEFKIAIAKLKSINLQTVIQSANHKPFISVSNKEELPDQ
jgi:hypothetical protein